jgi:hypothetical protein
LTFRVKLPVVVWPCEFVAETLMTLVDVAIGVLEIRPVAALKLSGDGRAETVSPLGFDAVPNRRPLLNIE